MIYFVFCFGLRSFPARFIYDIRSVFLCRVTRIYYFLLSVAKAAFLFYYYSCSYYGMSPYISQVMFSLISQCGLECSIFSFILLHSLECMFILSYTTDASLLALFALRVNFIDWMDRMDCLHRHVFFLSLLISATLSFRAVCIKGISMVAIAKWIGRMVPHPEDNVIDYLLVYV